MRHYVRFAYVCRIILRKFNDIKILFLIQYNGLNLIQLICLANLLGIFMFKTLRLRLQPHLTNTEQYGAHQKSHKSRTGKKLFNELQIQLGGRFSLERTISKGILFQGTIPDPDLV